MRRDRWENRVKALVSGITGFAGTHLAEHLLASGDEVVGISRHGQWSGDVPPALEQAVPLFRWELPGGPAPAAEEQLLAAYGVLSSHDDRPPTARTVTRLIRLYEAWGKPEEAAEWRAKLATGPGQVEAD